MAWTTLDFTAFQTLTATEMDQMYANMAGLKDGTLFDAGAIGTSDIAAAAVTPPKWTNPYKFRAYRTSNFTSGAAAFLKIPFNLESFDSNSNFDSTTNNRYVAPVAGFYFFNAVCQIFSAPSGSAVSAISLYKNGVEVARGNQNGSTGSSGSWSNTVSDVIQLAAGDFMEVYIYSSAAVTVTCSSTLTNFSGFLVSET